MTKIAAIIGAFVLLLLMPVSASADGPSACTFTGTVTLDNAQVADRTLITAIIAGDAYNTHTSTVLGYSTYFLTITAPEGKTYADGTKVTFKVNGRDTGNSATYKAGANIELDLASTTSSTLSRSSVTIAASSVIGCLVIALVAYYILVRRRGLKIAGWSRIKGAISSEKAVAASAEGEVIYSRYIWDSDKFAWVENTAGKTEPHQKRQSLKMTLKTNDRSSGKRITPSRMEQDTLVTFDSQQQTAQQQPLPIAEVENITDEPVSALFEGNVKLLVTSTLGPGQLREFTQELSRLKSSHIIEISRVNFVSKESASFDLFLPRPVPLVRILKVLPDVDAVSDESRRNLVQVRLK